MDALGDYLGVLWRQSMHRMVDPARCGEADMAAYHSRLARRPRLEYSPVTRRWEIARPPVRLYLAARDGVVLRQPDGKAA